MPSASVNITYRSILSVLRSAEGAWVDIATLRRIAGDQADKRVRELRTMGHVIHNRTSPQTHAPQYSMTQEASPRCGDCGEPVGSQHGRSCVMRGLTVYPGHCPVR